MTREPLNLLQTIPGATFSPLADPERCCGGSGIFSLSHYDLADKVRRVKLADMARSGAETVATGCSACRMHLEEGLVQAEAPQRVLHTVEILARAVTAGGALRPPCPPSESGRRRSRPLGHGNEPADEILDAPRKAVATR